MEEKDKEKETLRQAVRNQSRGYIMGGLGFVAGLAWNDAIRTLIESFFTFAKDSTWAKFVYAALVTAVVILIGRYVFKQA